MSQISALMIREGSFCRLSALVGVCFAICTVILFFVFAQWRSISGNSEVEHAAYNISVLFPIGTLAGVGASAIALFCYDSRVHPGLLIVNSLIYSDGIRGSKDMCSDQYLHCTVDDILCSGRN